jgi:hypothetical protein
MKTVVVNLFAITCLIIACHPGKELASQKPDDSGKAEVIHHLKMELLAYEIVDTVNISVEMAEMMIGMMKPSFETELVFNSTKSAELVKENDTYVRNTLYDRSTKTVYEFARKDSIEFYSEVNTTQMMEETNPSDEELEEFAKIFKVVPYSDSKTEILGFKCDEVIMMQPPDYTEIYVRAYTTDKIPHFSEAMGPMSKYFTGAPIKTIMFLNGIKVTVGANELGENRSLERFLKVDKSKLQELSQEELESMKRD